jgi:propanol-preferring alcohol dehydrogenase
MRAARLTSPGPVYTPRLRIDEVPDPFPSQGQLLVSVRACAVCRTDLQIAEGDLAPRRLPITPGHQLVGEVLATGPGVPDWQPGSRVGVGWLAETCGNCEYCRSGRENLCLSAKFTGWDVDGGFAEGAVVDARFAFAIPDGFADLDAAPLLCGGVIGYRSLRVSGIEPGGRLGLYGFGASASLCIQVARYWGCEIYVCTRSQREAERARQLGAAWAGGYDDALPVQLDAAVTFAPAGEVVIAALRALAPGGTVAINAIHLDRIPEFSYDHLWRERALKSVANFTRSDATEFLELAARIPVVTHRTRSRTPMPPSSPSEKGASTALRSSCRGRAHGTLTTPTGLDLRPSGETYGSSEWRRRSSSSMSLVMRKCSRTRARPDVPSSCASPGSRRRRTTCST